MRNAFTVDLEDWYQGIGIPAEHWNNYEKRIRVGHDKLMKLLSKQKVKATFFVLGKIIEEHPDIIREIIDEGHEVGCHTYTHQALYDMNPTSFRAELKTCAELIAAFGLRYTGFKAPFFSVDHRSFWALDVLAEEGFQYDASIYPGDSKRTGIVGYRKDLHQLENNLWEMPASIFKLLHFDVGLGGAFFRILPYAYFRKKFKEIARKRDTIFYIHPWELDPEHPYLPKVAKRIRYPHYFNLKSTEGKLERLFDDFEFTSVMNIIEEKYGNRKRSSESF